MLALRFSGFDPMRKSARGTARLVVSNSGRPPGARYQTFIRRIAAYIFLTGGLFFALQPVLEPRQSEAA